MESFYEQAGVFLAIAEPQRRAILDLLASDGELPVNDLVEALALPQPAVSKHLKVLRDVGIVSCTRRGQQRVYKLEAAPLKHVHEWIGRFERFWEHKLDRIKLRAERQARLASSSGHMEQHEKKEST